MFIFSLCEVTEIFSRFDFNKLLMCCKGGSLKIMYESCVWLPDRSEKTFKSINIYFYNLARERGIIMGIWVLFCETSFIERVWAQGSLLSFNEFELLFLYCFVWLCGKCLPQNKQWSYRKLCNARGVQMYGINNLWRFCEIWRIIWPKNQVIPMKEGTELGWYSVKWQPRKQYVTYF